MASFLVSAVDGVAAGVEDLLPLFALVLLFAVALGALLLADADDFVVADAFVADAFVADDFDDASADGLYHYLVAKQK